MIGALTAAFITEDVHPKWAFLSYGCFGFVIAFCCCFLSREAEIEDFDEELELGFESFYSSEYVEGQLPREAII